jgi:hypothetical protein
MPVDLLNPVLALPLEREFEGWITWKVLDYFEDAGRDVRLWAVSPHDEATWPADEHVWLPGKIIGLQFKRPALAPLLAVQTFAEYDRLHWDLGADPDQFKLVKETPEIFYCLPTFVNRDWRKDSLHHCIFWRPTRKMAARPIWYENPLVNGWSGRIDRHANTFRWGGVIERLQNCEFGYKVEEESAADFREHLRTQFDAAGLLAEAPGREPLYLLNVRLNDSVQGQ